MLGAPQGVASAVQNASAKTGVDFTYLLKQAQVESSFDTDVKAKGSSATGLYQFIDQTWLRMVKEHGAEYGKADWANAITQGKDGHFSVSGHLKSTVLNARKDAEFSSLMAGEFASENKDILEKKTGKQANATDLYMAHFLGAGGASTFLNAMKDNPLQTASTLFPSAARSNRAVFYNEDGTSKSLAEVYDKFAAKFAGVTDQPIKSPVLKPEHYSATLEAAAVSDRIDTIALLGLEPSNTVSSNTYHASSSSYMGVQTPVQSMIGNDLLSGPLLSLFTSNKAQENNDKDDKVATGFLRGFGNLTFNA